MLKKAKVMFCTVGRGLAPAVNSANSGIHIVRRTIQAVNELRLGKLL